MAVAGLKGLPVTFQQRSTPLKLVACLYLSKQFSPFTTTIFQSFCPFYYKLTSRKKLSVTPLEGIMCFDFIAVFVNSVF